VPKFFDGVLSKRASEAVTLKGHWWDARRSVAAEGIKEKPFKVRGCARVELSGVRVACTRALRLHRRWHAP
jgi:hypothetical protein